MVRLALLLADAVPPAETTLLSGLFILLATIITGLVKHFARERAEARLRTVDNLIHIAYLATAEVAQMAAMGKAKPVLDKAAHALALFDQAFTVEGLPPPSTEERSRAQLTWKALHGQELMQRALPLALPDVAMPVVPAAVPPRSPP